MGEQNMVTINQKSLSGAWRKTTLEDCASRYPGQLELRANGLYFAPGSAQSGAYWHGGDWRLKDDKQIFIQMANDAMVGYQIMTLSENELTLQDSSGCRFIYQRVNRSVNAPS